MQAIQLTTSPLHKTDATPIKSSPKTPESEIKHLLQTAPGTFEERIKKHTQLAQGLPKEKVLEIYKEYPALGSRVVANLFKSDSVQTQFEQKTTAAYTRFETMHRNALAHDASLRQQVAADLRFIKQETKTQASAVPAKQVSLCNKCAFQATLPSVTPGTIALFIRDVETSPKKYPLLDARVDLKPIYENAFLEDRVLFSFAKFMGYGRVEVQDTTGVSKKATGQDRYAYDLSQEGKTLQVKYTPGHWSHVGVR